MHDLHVTEWGDGARVVLLHGSLSNGVEAWGAQLPLAEAGYRLVLPDRRGYGGSALDGHGGEDYERDAQEIAPLLGEGAHLVGHSYGALSAMWAAALRPEAVRSLTLIEPPAFGLVPDDPVVVAHMARFRSLWERTELSDREFLREFALAMEAPPEFITDELLDAIEPSGPTLRGCRVVWEASVPLDILNGVLFPKLVVSGGHNAAFDVVCDALADAMGARHVVLRGAGHMVQMLGEPMNSALLNFWMSADAAAVVAAAASEAVAASEAAGAAASDEAAG